MRVPQASLFCIGVVAAGMVIGSANVASAEKIVLSHDEYQTSNDGFAADVTGSTNFVLNVAEFFTGGVTGSFLVVSDNFSLDLDEATVFASTLTGAGHTVVDSEDIGGFAFNLATLQTYDGVFLALEPSVDQNVLINYVNSGGNVYVNGGTGYGGSSQGEAAAWNTFLNTFGLNLADTYNGINGVISITSSHQVLSSVASLYQDNGNSVSLVGGNPNAQIIASFEGQGLYGVYDAAPVPEPATLSLLGLGLGAGVVRRRMRRR